MLSLMISFKVKDTSPNLETKIDTDDKYLDKIIHQTITWKFNCLMVPWVNFLFPNLFFWFISNHFLNLAQFLCTNLQASRRPLIFPPTYRMTVEMSCCLMIFPSRAYSRYLKVNKNYRPLKITGKLYMQVKFTKIKLKGEKTDNFSN